MDAIFQKARVLAQETARRSQDLAKEAAKMSQEFALETAKKSKELAVEATKRADQIKAFAAGELSPAATPSQAAPSQEELDVYGITPELQEFVKTFKIKTFREYELKDVDVKGARQELTEWQEKHAVLLLQVVPEISDFRYVLCPRRMKETVFWKIYFKLVENYIAPFEARANITESSDQPTVSKENEEKTEENVKKEDTEHDLDAYLLGGLDEETHGDDGSDTEFDRLVNSTGLDSEGEDHKKEATSSDGELVEIPPELRKEEK